MRGPSRSHLDSSEHKESISKNTPFNVKMLLYYIWFNVQVFEMVGLFYIGNRIYLPLSKFLNFLLSKKREREVWWLKYFPITLNILNKGICAWSNMSSTYIICLSFANKLTLNLCLIRQKP